MYLCDSDPFRHIGRIGCECEPPAKKGGGETDEATGRDADPSRWHSAYPKPLVPVCSGRGELERDRLLRRREVSFVHGPVGAGKSALLAHLIAHVLVPPTDNQPSARSMPPSAVGLHRNVWLVDMTAKFPLERLQSETEVRLETDHQASFSSRETIEEEATSRLRMVNFFRPFGSLGLIAVLKKCLLAIAAKEQSVGTSWGAFSFPYANAFNECWTCSLKSFF